MKCSKCGQVCFHEDWAIVGGDREGSKITGGRRLCGGCSADEIDRLQIENTNLREMAMHVAESEAV